jgi:hypothetical protein
MKLDVRVDIEAARQKLRYYQRDAIPKATVRALNDTAFQVRKIIQTEMTQVFDRPTRWTLNAPWTEKASLARWQSSVGLQGKAVKSTDAYAYLGPHIHGGARPAKRSERLLRERGILPAGLFAVPGAGARIDSYGNMSRGQMQEILANVRAHFDPHQRTRQGAKTKYFHAIIRGTNGIWMRKGFGVLPVLLFVRAPVYQRRFLFYKIAELAAARIFPKELDRQIGQQLMSRGK